MKQAVIPQLFPYQCCDQRKQPLYLPRQALKATKGFFLHPQ